MIRFLSLGSGSSGNCYFLGCDEGALIIDAGVSLRRMKQILGHEGLSYDSFSFVLVTHDHMDHVRSLHSYCKKLSKPVYATEFLHNAMAYRTIRTPDLARCRRDLAPGWNNLGPFRIKWFEVPHDASQTVGYAIEVEGHKFLIMTDIGRMTDEAVALAREADTVVVESNYDLDMLMSGPYTYDLKMRICKGNGHLSNDECAKAIKRFWHPGLRNLFLCHLSENNNTPSLAYDSARRALSELGALEGSVNLRTLPRRTPSPLMIL
ncbi:MAG: MBL fold metallo-hydrolase [Bacteroidales bacterium]|nr:MBL fold metallo-hydrolase [Bacteroidales bacterium]